MPKTYTLADWQKLALKRGKVDVISIAKEDGRKSRLLVRCKTCGHESTVLNYELRRVGCKKCFLSKFPTKEQALAQLTKKHKNLKFKDFTYTNQNTYVKYECLVCGLHHGATYRELFNNESGCPRCSKVYCPTTQEAQERLKKLQKNIIVYPFEYKNAYTIVKYECKTCGFKQETPFDALLRRKHGCIKCSGNATPTSAEAIDRLHTMHPSLHFYPFKYMNSHMQIKYRCTVCSLEYNSSYSNLVHKNRGCPRCAGHYSPSTEEAKLALFKAHPELEYQDFVYGGCFTKVMFRCNKCGLEKESSYNYLLHGSGCPKCGVSKLETATAKILHEISIPYKSEHKFNLCVSKRALPFDFYIDKLNLVIECHGAQHYRSIPHFNKRDSFEYRKKKDKIKLEFCKNNGVNILFVIQRSESDYKDVYNPTIFIDELHQTLSSMLQK